MKETISFKWTREDGCSVVIENNVTTAYDAAGKEISPDTDEAEDLFVESAMVLEQTIAFQRINGDDDKELRDIPMFSDFMFGGPMMHLPFGYYRHHNDDDEESNTPEEFAYRFRKEEMDMMRRHRQMEREREARMRQQIIDTAVPYDAPESCPDNLITENNRHYIKEKGTAIVKVGHDTKSNSLYNIVDADNRFLLPRHCPRTERITRTRFLLADENGIWKYYDISTQTMFFSVKTDKVSVIDDRALAYSDDTHKFCYDTDGNLIAVIDKAYGISRIIGGRPVIAKEDEHNNYYVYNLVLQDGTLLFDQWQSSIHEFEYPGRFLAQSKDMYASVLSSEDFSLIYRSERPRRLKYGYRLASDPHKDFFIFNTVDDKLMAEDSGIIVNVLTGEVISKDKDGNPLDYKRVEYPGYATNHWMAEVSVKTHRMENIDPITGKRLRKNKA